MEWHVKSVLRKHWPQIFQNIKTTGQTDIWLWGCILGSDFPKRTLLLPKMHPHVHFGT